ncbi:unnamed protein product [Coregonus sp. 'balchen']|nr:unnamed protein product [Coregonus sp. 'balchen']
MSSEWAWGKTGARLQQPLSTLLISMVLFCFIHQMTIMLFVCEVIIPSMAELDKALHQIYNFTMTWLHILYYVNIVPNNGQLFVWLKRHIENMVYISLVVDRIVLLVTELVGYTRHFTEDQHIAEDQLFN